MSVSCSRNYTLHVNPALGLWFWNLDEASPNADRIDKVNGLHLVVETAGGFNNPVVDASGLYVKGVEFNNPTPANSQLKTGDNPTAALKYLGNKGVTFWCWVKNNNVALNPGPIIVPMFLDFFNDAAGTDENGLLEIIISNFNINAVVKDRVNNDTYTGGQIYPIAGVYNFIVLKYDPTNLGANTALRIDNIVWNFGAKHLAINDSNFVRFVCNTTGGGNNCDVTIDEMGLYYGVLTDAQITALFNCEFGKTWPDVLALVQNPAPPAPDCCGLNMSDLTSPEAVAWANTSLVDPPISADFVGQGAAPHTIWYAGNSFPPGGQIVTVLVQIRFASTGCIAQWAKRNPNGNCVIGHYDLSNVFGGPLPAGVPNPPQVVSVKQYP